MLNYIAPLDARFSLGSPIQLVADGWFGCQLDFGFTATLPSPRQPRMATRTPRIREALTDQSEIRVREFADSLSEKDRRRFVALEAERFGYGGVNWICRVVGCSPHTVERGRREFGTLADDPAASRVRRPGAGRKKRSRSTPRSRPT